MNKRRFFVTAFALAVAWLARPLAADNARDIMQEAQRRTEAKSQRYEGLLQVFDVKGKTSEKRWTLERLGAHGTSKMVLRFTAPAEAFRSRGLPACWQPALPQVATSTATGRSPDQSAHCRPGNR